ncbi:GNAT family N-acetyltransferase [Natronoglycomyces albus]|uniref:GNAT family N-acetyltransferase n=1 Tax=Natronoglycomyces albus TaxID=2811108 RepID=A0A895XQ99_9ACTN|nr:GNAT family N-acetyltransferase [Natronoglycomyces albus]QSB04726.1 GNAT family N-acetyltransferase [Natronoglycomyces albus]
MQRAREFRAETEACALRAAADDAELAAIPAKMRPDSHCATLVAVRRRKVVGALQVTQLWGAASVQFWVHPQSRGSRLAASMVQTLASALFAFGVHRLETRVPVAQVDAIRAAMRAGLRPENLARGAFGGEDGLTLALTRGDRVGPAPRILPDLPGGVLSDGAVSLRALDNSVTDASYANRCLPEFVEQAMPQVAPTYESIRRLCDFGSDVDWLRGIAARLVISSDKGGFRSDYCGSVNVYNVSARIGEAMIGYELSPEARGKGLATRAVRLLCDWMFDDVGFARLSAGTDVHNIVSQSVLRRSGFRLEGTLRGELPGPGLTRRDILRWAKLNPKVETKATALGMG